MKIVDSETMKTIDERTIKEYGINGIVLMENAGRGVYEVIIKRYPSLKKVSIFAGRGNNGGDGFVTARFLKNNNRDIDVYLMGKESDVSDDAKINLDIWKNMGGNVYAIQGMDDIKRYSSRIRHTHLIVDAIFGTGLKREVTGIYKDVIEFINSLDKKVISIDIPSGIDASTGRILGCCIKADITITMVLPKIGLITYPSAEYVGDLEVVDIGMPKQLLDNKNIKSETIDRDFIKTILKNRPKNSHKGTFGHVLVLAGSIGKTGAAAMTSLGAMRIGAGLVTLGIPESLNNIMEQKLTEVMTEPLPETKSKTLGEISFKRIMDISKDKQAIAIGPGLTATNNVKKLVLKLIKEIDIPLVIDADALNILKENLSVLKKAKAQMILTPHPGEMARLSGLSNKDIQADRINIASEFARKNKIILVLKGARTVVAEPLGMVYINMTGNAGLATAGTGDVLTGMIAGFIAQGYTPIHSAIMGVYIHGLAGDGIAKKIGEIGMMATDLLNILPCILKETYMPI